jgi:hypothetical protein
VLSVLLLPVALSAQPVEDRWAGDPLAPVAQVEVAAPLQARLVEAERLAASGDFAMAETVLKEASGLAAPDSAEVDAVDRAGHRIEARGQDEGVEADVPVAGEGVGHPAVPPRPCRSPDRRPLGVNDRVDGVRDPAVERPALRPAVRADGSARDHDGDPELGVELVEAGPERRPVAGRPLP